MELFETLLKSEYFWLFPPYNFAEGKGKSIELELAARRTAILIYPIIVKVLEIASLIANGAS